MTAVADSEISGFAFFLWCGPGYFIIEAGIPFDVVTVALSSLDRGQSSNASLRRERC